jgi:hypothetical protein
MFLKPRVKLIQRFQFHLRNHNPLGVNLQHFGFGSKQIKIILREFGFNIRCKHYILQQNWASNLQGVLQQIVNIVLLQSLKPLNCQLDTPTKLSREEKYEVIAWVHWDFSSLPPTFTAMKNRVLITATFHPKPNYLVSIKFAYYFEPLF